MLPHWGSQGPARYVVTIFFTAEAGPVTLNFSSVEDTPDDAIHDVLVRVFPIVGLPYDKIFVKKVFPYVRSTEDPG